MIKSILFVGLLVVCFFVPLAVAHVYVDGNVTLGYGNGTYVGLSGFDFVYDLERIDNVWYVNGEVYPSVVVGDNVTSVVYGADLVSLRNYVGAGVVVCVLFVMVVVMVMRRNKG